MGKLLKKFSHTLSKLFGGIGLTIAVKNITASAKSNIIL